MTQANTALALALVQPGITIETPKPAKAARKPAAKGKAKPKALSGAQVETIASIAPAAWQYAKAKNNVVAIVKAIGSDERALKAMQRTFHVGYVAYRLAPDAIELTQDAMDNAARVLDSAGKDAKKLADGQSRRTDIEEKAYGASRTAWKVIMWSAAKKAKGKTYDTRNGKRGARTPAAKETASQPVSTTQATSKMQSKDEFHAYALQTSATLLLGLNKNAKLGIMPQVSSAISDFHTAMKTALSTS